MVERFTLVIGSSHTLVDMMTHLCTPLWLLVGSLLFHGGPRSELFLLPMIMCWRLIFMAGDMNADTCVYDVSRCPDFRGKLHWDKPDYLISGYLKLAYVVMIIRFVPIKF